MAAQGSMGWRRTYPLALLSVALASTPAVIAQSSEASASSASVAVAGWPQYQYGPARVAFNPHETVIGTANVRTLVMGWNTKLPASLRFNLASPVISGSTMYLIDSALVAINTASGRVRWSVAGPGVGSESTPAIDGGEVFARWSNGGSKTWVRAYDATTGGLRWSRTLPAVTDEVMQLAARDGRVYLTNIESSGGVTLYALDETTGAVDWSRTFSSFGYIPAVTASIILLGLFDGTVVALNPATGVQLWTASTPALVEGIGIEGSVAYVVGDCHVVALNTSDGSPVFSISPPGCSGLAYYGPALAYGLVYVADNNHHLYAIDGLTGAIHWTATIESGGDPSVANGVVYRAGHLLQAFNAATGAPLLNLALPGHASTLTGADITGGHVYMWRDGFHGLYADMYRLP